MSIRWLNKASQLFLERDYLVKDQTIEDRIDIICRTAENILNKPGFAKAFKEGLYNGWYSLSTPIWHNFGNNRGLPISCFSSMIEDSIDSILYTQAEVGIMTKYGGGTAAYFGKVRGRGSLIQNGTNGETSGSVHFMKLYESVVQIISQGSARRGNFAAYLPIDHPDIYEFLSIRNEGHPIQDISFGVCVTDSWMQSMIDGDKQKRNVWAKVLESRTNKGYPYIIFIDNVNKNTVDVYKDLNLEITHSNLCSEILLHTNENESFVCDLSSMNILFYEEWKNTNAVELLTYFLDAVMTEFITKAKHIRFLERAVKFAERQRALGIGWLGWHSFLQSKMIPFESMEAKRYNVEIAKLIKERAYAASKQLAEEYGEPELLKGYGRRNVTLCAIAPTKSSAFILGQVSEGIEPHRTNYYIKDLQKGKFTIKNEFLEKLLEEKGKNSNEVWQSILKNGGSVQHLDFLSAKEKSVFKTFSEISQMEIVVQAAQRQKYIDQGQSLNIMIHPDIPIKVVNNLIIEAWKLGIKAFYYQISINAAQNLARSLLTCTSCEA
jgi:ribonucleoside-diphosphate reductase alpha chain